MTQPRWKSAVSDFRIHQSASASKTTGRSLNANSIRGWPAPEPHLPALTFPRPNPRFSLPAKREKPQTPQNSHALPRPPPPRPTVFWPEQESTEVQKCPYGPCVRPASSGSSLGNLSPPAFGLRMKGPNERRWNSCPMGPSAHVTWSCQYRVSGIGGLSHLLSGWLVPEGTCSRGDVVPVGFSGTPGTLVLLPSLYRVTGEGP